MSEALKWHASFLVDTTTCTGLRWRDSGEVAGWIRSDATAYGVRLGKKNYLVHRVLWSLVFGSIPQGMDVDHKDGDGLNNNLSNLRLVPHKVNMRNQRKRNNNTSGTTGVSRHLKTHWVATWMNLDGKQGRKYFSIKLLGDAEAKAAATSHRQTIIEQLNQQSAEYTERHGR